MRMITCVLAIVAGVFLAVGTGSVAEAQKLYDGFDAPLINAAKWAEREAVREIVDGRLALALSDDGSAIGNNRHRLNFTAPAAILSIACDLTVVEAIPDSGGGANAYARLDGFFYSNGSGTTGDGEVWATVMVGDFGSGLEAIWSVGMEIGGGWYTQGSGNLILPGALALGTANPVSIEYDGDHSFTFSVNGVQAVFEGPERNGPAFYEDRRLTVGLNVVDGSRVGYISALYDNVAVNGELYDDFSSTVIDGARWREPSMGRRVIEGKLSMAEFADGSQQQVALALASPGNEYLQADVAVAADSWVTGGAEGMARIGGFVGNDSRGQGSGQSYNGFMGDLWADVRLGLGEDGQPRATCKVDRIDTVDTSSSTHLFQHTFSLPIAFDTFYTLSMGFKNNQFTFACDGETITFDLGMRPFPPHNGYYRQLATRVTAQASQSGWLRAAFDNVHVSSDDYLIYSKFEPSGIADVVQVGGYVEDYGVPTTWGDEIQYIYFLSGTTAYKVRLWLTDSTDPDDPTDYVEPRQHPDHPNPAFRGPIEPRHFQIVSSADLAPYIYGSESHSEEFHVDASGVYLGAYPFGIQKFDHNWQYLGQITAPPPERTESLAYDKVNHIWYAGGRTRTIYQIFDTNGDGDLMDEVWLPAFSYPTYQGSHHDGMEFGFGFLWISDMTSDLLGQWQVDPQTGLWTQLAIYTYTNPDHVEGMGFGPNNHFWCGSGWGETSYFYELGDDITTRYPVAVAGEDVPNHPPEVAITFDASGSYHQNPQRRIVLYQWDFECDGVWDYSGTDPVVQHTYTAVYHPDGTIDWPASTRTHDACLQVTDDTPLQEGGPLKSTDSKQVAIGPPPYKPVADPNGPYSGRVDTPVILDGSKSYDPESILYPPDHPWYEEIASCEWDMNEDGIFDDRQGCAAVDWIWENEGTYFPCLRVTDSQPSGPGGSFTEMDQDIKCSVVVIGSVHDIEVAAIAPSSDIFIIGQTITVTADVLNTGDYMESFAVNLNVDGAEVDSIQVDVLAPGGSHTVTLQWSTAGYDIGPHLLSVQADPVQGEIDVEDNFKETTVSGQLGLEMAVDIKPGSCPNPLNTDSKGVLPVAILGSERLDVETIDTQSIRLSREGFNSTGIAPIRWSMEDVGAPYIGEGCGCHDLNGDGYADLTLKFLTQEVVNTFGLKDSIGEDVPLTLTAILANGMESSSITGSDCVTIVK